MKRDAASNSNSNSLFPSQVRGYESNLTVTITESSIGKYICRASVKGFTEITAAAEVMMKGPPHILRRAHVEYGRVGSDLRLTCDAFAIPPPETLFWSANGFTIMLSSDHYTVEETARKDGMRSTLIIHEAIETDFMDYNCSVRNSHGQDSFTITLEKRSKCG